VTDGGVGSLSVSPSCVAVGYDERADGGDGGPIAETWNGRTWSVKALKLPAGTSGGALFGVACKSQKSCAAVGDAFLKNDNTAALAESWNGKTWTTYKPSAPGGATSAALQGVSCVSTTDCAAVGWYTRAGGGSVGLAQSWNGKKWAEIAMPRSPGNGALYNVSCVSAKYCLAVGGGGPVGNSQGTPSSDVWNGKSWAFKHVPVPATGGGSTAYSTLQGASCVSATDCVAVGELDLGSGEQFQYGFSGLWSGKAWRLVATA
jgi:hypothetical protein